MSTPDGGMPILEASSSGKEADEMFHSLLHAPIFGKSGCYPADLQLNPFVYCAMNTQNLCSPVTGLPTDDSSYYNFGLRSAETVHVATDYNFHQEFSTAAKTYAVTFNENVCPVSDAVDACVETAKSICNVALNTTNPNLQEALPMMQPLMDLIFCTLLLTISLVAFSYHNTCAGEGSIRRVESAFRRKRDKIVGIMMSQESAKADMIMHPATLLFYEEDREDGFALQRLQYRLSSVVFFFVSLIAVAFGTAIASPGLPNYHSRIYLSFCSFVGLACSVEWVFLKNRHLAMIFVGIFGSLSYIAIFVILWFDNIQGVKIGNTSLGFLTVLLSHLAMSTAFVFIRKAIVVTLVTTLYGILAATVFRRSCYMPTGDSYPSLSLFVRRETFRDSCDPDGEAKEFTWSIIATVFGTILSIYSAYSAERIERSSFDAKYEVIAEQLETRNKILRIESALKAKELNPDQLKLVTDLMKDGQEHREESGAQPRRRMSLIGGKQASKQTRRGSISSANAIQQLRIKQDAVEIVQNNIGRGAYGDVHKAKYNGMFVAIKNITKIDRETLLEFRNEILIMNQLRHPNIIMLLGAVWDKEMVGIVLEFADNGSLSDVLRKKKIVEKWSWAGEKLKIACDVAQGMRFMHSTAYFDEFSGEHKEHLLHRDLKTGNVLLTSSWSAKVADFGSTKVVGIDAENQTMTMAGTPIYMAPEIVRGEKYDKSCDVYGFAVMLYAMAVERGDVHEGFTAAAVNVSFRAEGTGSGSGSGSGTPMGLMSLVAENGIRPDLSTLEMHKSLKSLISRCWCDRPKGRPNFLEIIRNLDEMAESLESQRSEDTIRKKEEDEKALKTTKEKIFRSRAGVREFAAPLVLMKAVEFLKRTHLLSHEATRDLNSKSLAILDTMEKAETFLKGNYTIFFSHQWLSYTRPDPFDIQLDAMKEATKQLVAKAKVNLESTFVWCDYFSIAQESREIQRLAILSLPAVASSLHAFVVVAPPATHCDTLEQCSLATYKERGWCRAEVLSHISRRGTKRMFLALGGDSDVLPLDGGSGGVGVDDDDREAGERNAEELGTLPDNFLVEMCSVFSGNFTCCKMLHSEDEECDREKLLEPMLGLYCEIYRRRLNPSVAPIYKVIEANKSVIFPPEVDIQLTGGGSKRRKLFGDMLEVAEAEIDFENMVLGAQMQHDGAVELENGVAEEDKDLSTVLLHRQDLNFDLGEDGEHFSTFESVRSGMYIPCLYRGHIVAIDKLDLGLAEDIEEEEYLVKKFKRECLLMKELKHENILMMVGALWTSDLICLVLEFVPGGSIRDYLNNASQEDLKWWGKSKLKIAKGVVRGMAYLHGCVFYDCALSTYREGVIHRTLGSDSVLVGYKEDDDGRMIVKIFDFSQSRMAATDDRTMTVVGGDYSMAPEMYRGDRYDAKCDVFSFATLMVEMATAGSYMNLQIADLLSEAFYSKKEVQAGGSSQGRHRQPILSTAYPTKGRGGNSNEARIVKMFMRGLIKPTLDEESAPGCPGVVLDLINRCHAYNPSDRPSFSEIDAVLKGKDIENQLIQMSTDKDEEKLRELKMELERGSALRDAELQAERTKAQKRLRERMEKVRAKKVAAAVAGVSIPEEADKF